MLDFMKLFYGGDINQLHQYSDLDPDRSGNILPNGMNFIKQKILRYYLA